MTNLEQLFEQNRPRMSKKLIMKLGAKSVYLVDGNWIRDYEDVNFINRGQHYEFKFIPEYELWIDNIVQKVDWPFLIDGLLVQRRAMKRGVSLKKAEALGEKKMRSERHKFLRDVMHIEPKDVDIKKKLWKKIGDIKVYIVDTNKVDEHYLVDFTEGAHAYAFGFIPKKEIWIGNDVHERERPWVLLHEYTEMLLMRDKHWSYPKAHKRANVVEHLARIEEHVKKAA